MTGSESTTTSRTTTATEEPMSGSEAKHPFVEAGQEASEKVGRLAERAGNLGLQQADRGREQAATGIDAVARTIRRVSTDMQTQQPAIADIALTAADQADRMAQYLRQNDARQIIGTVEDAARRTPLLFLGGAFLLGVAASRFIKAASGGQAAASERQSSISGFRDSKGYEATGPGPRNGNEGF